MTPASFLGEALFGWLAADLSSGVFHWWQDRCTRESWPVIGPWLISPSRLHHREPLAFLNNGFLLRNRAAIGTSICVGGLYLYLFGPSVALAFSTLGGAITTQVHTWTHRPSKAPKIVRVLQETGVLQSAKHHAGHHRPPSDRNYCILTGWLNPMLDALRVWERAEEGAKHLGLRLSHGTA